MTSLLNILIAILLNPLDFGLGKAKTDIERYEAIRHCHAEAYAQGNGVTYDGVGDIAIEIPDGAESIKLTEYTDFAGARITVKNNSHDIYLFSMKNDATPIEADGKKIDAGDYNTGDGIYLVSIKDSNPWVEQRIGYKYGTNREDLAIVVNGKAVNRTVMPYGNEQSKPMAEACKVNDREKIIKNLNLVRSSDSKYKTYLIWIHLQYRVAMENITIDTPNDSTLASDLAIRLSSSADIRLDNITINKTYCAAGSSGYGFHLNNIYDFKGIKLRAKARWGIFGTNFVNRTTLEDCDINRYDIHCYGRDITARNCRFADTYNQFSSIYGLVIFDRCTFDRCTPLLTEYSYNAFTPYELIFNECTFNFDKKANSVVELGWVENQINNRPELSQKCLPNVTMTSCTINTTNELKEIRIFDIKTNCKERFDHIKFVNLNDLKINGRAKLKVMPSSLKTVNKLKIIK